MAVGSVTGVINRSGPTLNGYQMLVHRKFLKAIKENLPDRKAVEMECRRVPRSSSG